MVLRRASHRVLPGERTGCPHAEHTHGQDLHRPRLCAAFVGRLTFNGTIIETDADSYRLAHTRAHQGAPV